ncbi:hypothetical protein [Billgrantia kenyensis]|uniref:Uncharacterized protein n=1 Tax=Billgrantia kenyensis TaxID=321266 RepID=A0A7V9W4Z6_9GAMM|nr:hypothetical protein [Halomonas kenyensis]MBA2781173.1 hypothetical protein [Halomonas kenyensis]MCG6663853.1 hypothetical protein [Halomonas kenyensis]
MIKKYLEENLSYLGVTMLISVLSAALSLLFCYWLGDVRLQEAIARLREMDLSGFLIFVSVTSAIFLRRPQSRVWCGAVFIYGFVCALSQMVASVLPIPERADLAHLQSYLFAFFSFGVLGVFFSGVAVFQSYIKENVPEKKANQDPETKTYVVQLSEPVSGRARD